MVHRVATKLKLLRGNPGRRRIDLREPVPAVLSAVPDPPAYLDKYGAEEWRRLIVEARRLGLVTVVDLLPFAAYCKAYSAWRISIDQKQPYGSYRVKALDVVRHAGNLGFTPASRSRIKAGTPAHAADGKFDILLGDDPPGPPAPAEPRHQH
jgi:phage terminase small subunit